MYYISVWHKVNKLDYYFNLKSLFTECTVLFGCSSVWFLVLHMKKKLIWDNIFEFDPPITIFKHNVYVMFIEATISLLEIKLTTLSATNNIIKYAW